MIQTIQNYFENIWIIFKSKIQNQFESILSSKLIWIISWFKVQARAFRLEAFSVLFILTNNRNLPKRFWSGSWNPDDDGWTQKFKRPTTGWAVEHSGRYFCELLKRIAICCVKFCKVGTHLQRLWMFACLPPPAKSFRHHWKMQCKTTKQLYFYPLSAAPYACRNDFLRFQQHTCMQSWLHTTKREGVDDKPHIRSKEEKVLREMWLDRKICGCDNEKLKPRFLKIFAIKSF